MAGKRSIVIMSALVALPTDNEPDTIAEVLRRLRRTGLAADILRVDNASSEDIPPSPYPEAPCSGSAIDRRPGVVRPLARSSEEVIGGLVSLAVPTYNERENIIPLLDQVRAAMRGRALEVWVVDDNSPDGTWQVAEEYSTAHPEVSVVRRVGERGLSGAVIEGFRRARGELLAVIDADLSHDPALLPSLVDAVQAGAELAVGSRRVPGGGADVWPWYRRLASNAATRLAQWTLGVQLADPMSGYFVVRRDVFEAVRERLKPRGYKILLEIVARAEPLKLVELPFVFRDRRQGVSKVSPHIATEYLKSLRDLRCAANERRRRLSRARHPHA